MMRFAWPRLIAVLLVCPLFPATAALAQETAPAQEPSAFGLRHLTEGVTLLADQPRPPLPAPQPAPRRPGALVPLYVSFGTLQVLDAHSTARALEYGAVEANPALRGIAGNQVALLAVKAAGTTGLIIASEKIWKRNKVAAIALMVASNAAMAWVVQRNYASVR
jgi:hypothetical protein